MGDTTLPWGSGTSVLNSTETLQRGDFVYNLRNTAIDQLGLIVDIKQNKPHYAVQKFIFVYN